MELPNLYDLLKDEHKQKLQTEYEKYPYLVGRVIDELKKEEFILQLSFLTVLDLTNYLTGKVHIDFIMVKEFFYEFDHQSALLSNE